MPDEAAARKLVRQHLRHRATAPRRIGVAYRLRELTDPARWMARSSEGYDRTGDRTTIDPIERRSIR